MIWPTVFTDPESVVYPDTDEGYACAVADGCSGWGGCCAGNKPPENFGYGMIKIGDRIGFIATDTIIGRLADGLIARLKAKGDKPCSTN